MAKQMDILEELDTMRWVEDLLTLLEQYLDLADEWEDYYTSAANKEFTPACDKAKHAAIQTYEMLPLMERCKELGWAYADLVDIIPGAFKTTKQERRDLFRGLRMWAEEEYGIVPF